MDKIRIMISDRTASGPGHFYRYLASPAWARAHDNGCLISIGLTVGETLRGKVLLHAVPEGAVEVSFDEWNHAGCQSSCIRRGEKECRW